MRTVKDHGHAEWNGIQANVTITTEEEDGQIHSRVEVEVYVDGELQGNVIPYYRAKRLKPLGWDERN